LNIFDIKDKKAFTEIGDLLFFIEDSSSHMRLKALLIFEELLHSILCPV
jgi:hypothetical protein